MGKTESKTVTFKARDGWEFIERTLRKLGKDWWVIVSARGKEFTLKRRKKTKRGRKKKK